MENDQNILIKLKKFKFVFIFYSNVNVNQLMRHKYQFNILISRIGFILSFDLCCSICLSRSLILSIKLSKGNGIQKNLNEAAKY